MTPLFACQGGATAETYVSLAASTALSDRYTAAKALGWFRTAVATDALVGRLHDPNEHIYVRVDAAASLMRADHPEGARFLATATQDEFLSNRLEAVIVLSEVATPEASRVLVSTLLDSEQHAEIRAGAAWALGEIGAGDLLPVLIQSFQSLDLIVRIEAARATAKLARHHLDAVIQQLPSASPEERSGIAWALSKSGGFTIDQLIPGLVDDDARQWIAFIIGSQDEQSMLPQIEALASRDPDVYFGVTLLWKILASWTFGLEEYLAVDGFQKPLYMTQLGQAYVGDARRLLTHLQADSVDLVLTSPPFALQRQKAYGNEDQVAYVDWLLEFCKEVHRVLRPTGSLVLDLGGAYVKGRPVRSLYNYRVLIRLCDEQGFRLAEEFFWHNPAKLPSPIEWVNKRKIRAKDSVNTIWWLSKSDYPKADVTNVLVPYSKRMLKLLEDPDSFYSPKKRPSGHDIGVAFSGKNGGAIPPNLLQIPNTDSNSPYLRLCKLAGIQGHPARFPERLPAFFISFLTAPEDLVLDFFAGSNTTGAAAESAGRRWMAMELSHEYLAASALRFFSDRPNAEALAVHDELKGNPHAAIDITPSQVRFAL